MNESAFTPEPQLTAHLAEGRMWSYDGLDFVAPTFQLGEGPAGSMYTSVADLAGFISMVFNSAESARHSPLLALSARDADTTVRRRLWPGLFTTTSWTGIETFGMGERYMVSQHS